MNPLAQIVLLIANAVCTFLGALLLMRFFMQWARAPFDSPIGGFVLHLTDWLVLPLRRAIPAFRQSLDFASLLAAYLAQAALVALVSVLAPGAPAGLAQLTGILIGGAFSLVRLAIYLYIVLLVARALLSWFSPLHPQAPLNRLVARLTDPILRPLQKIIPPISGIDLTPLIAILVAQIILIFV
ncbi:MAG: YggT family protein [Candidatus Accumulibacter sp.]|jgi:YggT family protein|nr:YggT family protein [Accumulibacter sp.]